MNNIRPLGTRLLLSRPLRPGHVGLIAAPQTYQDDDKLRVVLAIGPKCCPEFAIGDVVVVGLGCEPKNVEDGTDRVVVDESAIECILPELAKNLIEPGPGNPVEP